MAKHLLAFAVLALCSVAALAAKGPADGYFADWLASASSAGKATTTKVSTASVGPAPHLKLEHEHVCLQETKLRDCRYVGCPSVQGLSSGCPESSPFQVDGCYNCINHISAVSDLSCCQDSSYGDTAGGFLADIGNVGSCEWDVDLFSTIDPEPRSNSWYSPVQIPGTDTYKIGTAWGTCQLTGSAGHCGHALCDKMVLRFQGGIYISAANSRVPVWNFEADDRECVGLFLDYLSGLGITVPIRSAGRDAAKPQTISQQLAATGLLDKLRPKTGDNNAAAAPGKEGAAPAAKDAAAAPATPAADPTPAKGAKGAAAYDSLDDISIVVESDAGFYEGTAVTMMGPFSVVSVDSSVEYEKGMLEYTPIFYTPIGSSPGPKNPQLPVVKPDAIRFNFVRNVKAKDAYKGKEEYGGEYEKKYYEAKEEYEQRYGKAEEGKEATEGKGEEDYKKMYEAMKGEYEAKYGKLEEKEEGKEGHETEEKKEKDESYYKKDL